MRARRRAPAYAAADETAPQRRRGGVPHRGDRAKGHPQHERTRRWHGVGMQLSMQVKLSMQVRLSMQ
eukprot:gene18728-19021_t